MSSRRPGTGGGDGQYHYAVLHTHVLHQQKVRYALKRALPEERGTVFCPSVELWRHDRKALEIRPLFPGYVFIHSDMDPAELHAFVRTHRRDVIAFIRELGVHERRLSAPSDLDRFQDNLWVLTDLDEAESAFMDFLLSGRKEAEQDALDSPDQEECVFSMSYGYREGDRLVVMEGPLKGHEDRIASVRPHDRKAYLGFAIHGHMVRVGLEIKPKRYWFPEDGTAPELLPDGTEVDLEKLRNRMMGGGMPLGRRNSRMA